MAKILLDTNLRIVYNIQETADMMLYLDLEISAVAGAIIIYLEQRGLPA